MLEWAHEQSDCPVYRSTRRHHTGQCTGNTSCEAFPTLTDRCNMAEGAYREYAGSDGTQFIDFFRDVVILAYIRKGLDLGALHIEVTKAYLLANGTSVPKELPL